MELKEFIKAAITDITDAISDLQNDLENGTVINPTLTQGAPDKCVLIGQDVRPIERLSFDVAVTASETSGIEGSAKAGINIFGAKVGTESSARTENASRLTFSIPLVYPATHVKTPTETMREKRRQVPKD